MPSSPISRLSPQRRRKLLADLNYLTMAEIKSFCKRHSIPYAISIGTRGGRRKTNETDRKGVILQRIRRFLKTGAVPRGTCFSSRVVCFDSPPETITANDRVYYGQYHKKNSARLAQLKNLTSGKFRDGAIARILAREFWSKGEAPTFREFATAWLKAAQNHKRPNPEWAFLSDRARGAASRDWKRLRASKAAAVIRFLDSIPVAEQPPGSI